MRGGLPQADFDQTVRDRQVKLCREAIAPSHLPLLFDFAALDQLLDDALVGEFSDVYREEQLVRMSDMQHKNSRTALDIAGQELRQGATIRIRDAHRFNAGLRGLSEALAGEMGGKCGINVYLTPPNGMGFPPHFDITDVFVIQVAGQKSWQLHESYTEQIKLPLPHTEWDPERYQSQEEVRELTLNAGDSLYLPRGEMHSARCLEEASMHLTAAIETPTYYDVLQILLRSYANDNVDLRRSVSTQDMDNVVRELQAQLDAFQSSQRSLPVIEEALESLTKSFQAADRQTEGICDVLAGLRPHQSTNKTK